MPGARQCHVYTETTLPTRGAEGRPLVRRASVSHVRGSLSLRDEVDPGQLNGRLLMVVEETMRPAQVSLWLREPSPRIQAALPVERKSR